jgi:hypothetical protein
MNNKDWDIDKRTLLELMHRQVENEPEFLNHIQEFLIDYYKNQMIESNKRSSQAWLALTMCFQSILRQKSKVKLNKIEAGILKIYFTNFPPSNQTHKDFYETFIKE